MKKQQVNQITRITTLNNTFLGSDRNKIVKVRVIKGEAQNNKICLKKLLLTGAFYQADIFTLYCTDKSFELISFAL